MSTSTFKINFTGGIIPPKEIMPILKIAHKNGARDVSFGLRQQLLIEVSSEDKYHLAEELDTNGIEYEMDADKYPNIISSYPAEDVFITRGWLTEAIYKEILQGFDYKPTLKINISDNRQSFTPLLTGNINWMASDEDNYWNLFIRFPKTNTIYLWKVMVASKNLVEYSKLLEDTILSNKDKFYDKESADGDELMAAIQQQKTFDTKPSAEAINLPTFMLPYYEGLNRYADDKYWLGIYRRDEKFSIKLLYDICKLSVETHKNEICSTPWKSLIIKDIRQSDRILWNNIMGKYQINVRHAANELNFQVEDNCKDGRELKNFLIKHLHADDIRTFGICLGIKTRRKSEIFSSILVRRKPLIRIGKFEFFHLYDILCAKDFNPNERTAYVFSSNNYRWLLPEQLRRAIVSYYTFVNNQVNLERKAKMLKASGENQKQSTAEYVYKCPRCSYRYDETFGESEFNIPPGTPFTDLPEGFICPVCEFPKSNFEKEKNIH